MGLRRPSCCLCTDGADAILQGAEAAVQRDVNSEVKSAVKDAIQEAVASDQLLTGSRRGTKLVHTLVKDAGKEAAKAGAQEVKEYGAEMSHITKELDSQLGGVMSLHDGKSHAAAGASSGSAAAGKGHSDWVSLATKVLQRQQHSRTGWRHERSNSEKQVQRAVEEKQQFAKEEKTIRQEASYQEGKSKKDVPFGSRKNPLYVRGEHQRDAEADADFKKLELLRETRQAKKKERKAASARVDRTAQANKYLKVMEKPVLKKVARKREDRNKLAAQYLHELIKHKQGKTHVSHAAAAEKARALSEKQYELARDAKAGQI
jgi:hypothetical protein